MYFKICDNAVHVSARNAGVDGPTHEQMIRVITRLYNLLHDQQTCREHIL
jgi:hypothetical protein